MERSTDKLARYTLYALAAAAVLALCWYFRSTLVYIVAAAVFSLISGPLMRLLGKIRIKGKSAPDGVLAVISIVLLLVLFFGIVTQIVPVMYGIVQNISANLQTASFSSSGFTDVMRKVNERLISAFPELGRDFRIETTAAEFIRKEFSLSSVTSVVGSVASGVASFGVALFSIVFIGFFFVKDQNLFRNIVAALVPDAYEERVKTAIGDIETLLSRYFIGLLIEVCGVALLNFLGLWLIARLDLSSALGIAFISGLLNVIPYLGPWLGAALGTVLGVVLRFSSAAAVGSDLNFVAVLLVILGVFVVTQLVDNFVFQPVIYSRSVKSSPLEIFIVLLLAGHVGGVFGMIAAIPAYTVVRVFAGTFFRNVKAIRRLIPE
ncbi:MAG: AI-2E family transporter [Bacteroidales bacterium]|nr:AI-2E family transporter [Bacteroidales bacterium]